jgi:flagellar protein FliO/FliZ
MTEDAVLRIAIGLVLVVAAIIASGWLARRAGLLQRGHNNLLRQVGNLTLGPRQSIIVVEVKNNWLVIGVTATQLTHLYTLPAENMPPEDLEPPSNFGFIAKLRQTLKHH